MTALLAASLFFAAPAPLDMPRAEAYFVRDQDGRMRLEDRYDETDLWTSRAVLGRWADDDGRVFTVARLDKVAPRFSSETVTRTRFESDLAELNPRKGDRSLFRDAISLLSPLDVPEEPVRPRQGVRGMRDVGYWQGTNETAIVCLFHPEKAPCRYLAVWELAEGDPFDDSLEEFEESFLAKWSEVVEETLVTEIPPEHAADRRRERPGERELLRAAAAHSVANYSTWRATQAPEFSVLDDLADGGAATASVTNELSRMRVRYAEVFPTPVDVSNSLAVARIFRDREEYLDALDLNDVEGMEWSAAYWSPSRRELVAYLPSGGVAALLENVRHEAFHQYLSYALSMITASPWLNEGYAQYFEDEDSVDWGIEVDVEQLAELLPALFAMDYEAFYGGSDAERRLKYRMAWSVAVFIEKGAAKVRFNPFRNLKRNYVEALLKHRDMEKATAAAFGSKESLSAFVSEWKKFWQDM